MNQGVVLTTTTAWTAYESGSGINHNHRMNRTFLRSQDSAKNQLAVVLRAAKTIDVIMLLHGPLQVDFNVTIWEK